LLIDEDGTQVWTTPVSLLDQLFLVGLLIRGWRFDPPDLQDPTRKPRIALAALMTDGAWTPCTGAGGAGGGGSERVLVHYATFARPDGEMPPAVRLDVRVRGTSVTREMRRNI
jgi:hypothetical protein